MKKRIALLCMLCGVLVLSGCGGSSRVDELERRVNVAEPLVEQLRRDLEVARTQAETAKTAEEAAKATAEAAQIRANLAETAKTEAEEERDAAVTARTAAETARDAAVRAKETAEAARDTAVTDAAQARAALQTAEAAQLAEQQRREQEEAKRAETEQAIVNARAGKYISALDMASQRSSATVEWMRDKSRMVDPGGDFATGSGAPGISGFSSYPFTRRFGVQGTEMAYLYTNIQAPGTRAFWKQHGLDVLVGDTVAGQWNASLARVSSLRATIVTYTDTNENNRWDSDGTEEITEARVSGSYNGASGAFTCTASCGSEQIEIDRDSTTLVPTFPAGTWMFKPSNINNGIRIAQDDAFLYFGIWAREPDVASDDHAFEVIYGGGGLNTGGVLNGSINTGVLNNFSALNDDGGSATFRGGAIGKYVTRNQVGENARIGTFTAQADFTAKFDTTPTLEGRITNFRESGQTLEGWDVFLGGTATGPATFTGGNVVVTSGAPNLGIATARIGRVAATGTWAATLYGSANHDLTDRTTYPHTRYPVADLAGVAGYFEASDNNAADGDPTNADVAIVGAFAAPTSSYTPDN